MSDGEYVVNENSDEEKGEEEDEIGLITPTIIREICKKRNMYTFPALNDELFLGNQGFRRIRSLEPFINVKSLWLNNNSINVIENIGHFTLLSNLYLNNNVIEEITGLSELVNMAVLNLNYNCIRKIKNMKTLINLTNLDIQHNLISEISDFQGLIDVPSLTSLDLSYNKIETENFLEVLTKLPKLAVLKLEGNPIAKTMRNYRRIIITAIPTLVFLDQQPVTEIERICSEAYVKEGGRDAEMAARKRYWEEKDRIKLENSQKLKRVNRITAQEKSIDISKNYYFLSSDDPAFNDEEEGLNEVD